MEYLVVKSCWPEECDRQLNPGEIVHLDDPGGLVDSGHLREEGSSEPSPEPVPE